MTEQSSISRSPNAVQLGALSTNTVENGVAGSQTDDNKIEKASIPSLKYRHVAAVHSRPRNSCLSRDSDISPSFLGFRNLMVLVVSEFYPYKCTREEPLPN